MQHTCAPVSKSHCEAVPFAKICKNGLFAVFTIDAIESVITEMIACIKEDIFVCFGTGFTNELLLRRILGVSVWPFNSLKENLTEHFHTPPPDSCTDCAPTTPPPPLELPSAHNVEGVR
jgi:hypothetical protein